MKVLFLVPYPLQGASNRFRVNQFLPLFEHEGITCRLRPFYSERLWRILYRPGRLGSKLVLGALCAINRLMDLARAVDCDLVFIHREAFPIGPAWFERLLGLLGKPYIYDFDDAVYLPNVAESNRLLGWLKMPGKVASIIRGSRVTLAGNACLADFARKSGAKDVRVAPTVVDTGRFMPDPALRREGPVVIGWIGSQTTIRFIEQLRPVMLELLERFPGQIEFRVVGGSLSGGVVPGISCRPWSLDNEIGELQAFHIGVMPIPDDEWTRGKCAFKVIEYLAVGAPAVCSPVGMNLAVVEPGVNGFLANSREEWIEALGRLISDPALRQSLGQRGREKIETFYSVKAIFPGILQAVLQTAGSAQKDGNQATTLPDSGRRPFEPGITPTERIHDHR